MSLDNLYDEKWYENALLGCHIGVMKRILGGKSGYSGGKVNRALKKPPSLGIKIRIRETTRRADAYYSVSGGLRSDHHMSASGERVRGGAREGEQATKEGQG